MKTLLVGILTFCCVCGAFAQGTTGTTTTTTTTTYVFPPVLLGANDTIAVNVVNIAPVSTATGAMTPSCTGTVTFRLGSGTVANTGGAAQPFTVGSDVTQTISLKAATAGITSNPGAILASVQQTITRPMTTPCSLVFSLQVYDATGETHVFMGNTAASIPPSALPLR